MHAGNSEIGYLDLGETAAFSFDYTHPEMTGIRLCGRVRRIIVAAEFIPAS
jgi:hypothetical protein